MNLFNISFSPNDFPNNKNPPKETTKNNTPPTTKDNHTFAISVPTKYAIPAPKS